MQRDFISEVDMSEGTVFEQVDRELKKLRRWRIDAKVPLFQRAGDNVLFIGYRYTATVVP